MIFFRTIYIDFFFLNSLFFYLFKLLLNSFCNLWYISFLFMTFLCLLHSYLHHCCLMNSYMFSLLIQEILSWFVRIIHLSLVQLFIHFFFLVMACLILCGAKTFFKIFCNIFANIICFYMDNEPVYIRITEFCIFTSFGFT